MLHLRLFTVFFSGILVMSLTAPAYSWNDTGHMLAAEIAWRQMGAAQRAKAIAILRAAFDNSTGQGLAQFEQDLTQGMPAHASEADKERWIFLKAATWPDLIRAGSPTHPLTAEFHKGEWHY